MLKINKLEEKCRNYIHITPLYTQNFSFKNLREYATISEFPYEVKMNSEPQRDEAPFSSIQILHKTYLIAYFK